MKVLKFGGSSVANPKRILQVINILATKQLENADITVVFSAFGGITDLLLKMSTQAEKGQQNRYKKTLDSFTQRHIETAQQLITGDLLPLVIKKLNNNHKTLSRLLNGVYLTQEASLRTKDFILSFGERNSAFIIQKALESKGINSIYLDAREIIETNDNFGHAQVKQKKTEKKIQTICKKNHHKIKVVTGFIGATKQGITTTLGRGGSDYTASLIAAAINADILEIWTDVSGVLTADPRKVSNARPIAEMSYIEAMEMSHFGAKVIYPPTIQPILDKNIPLVIKNTLIPEDKGTFISSINVSNQSNLPIKGISSITDITLISLQGSGLFGVPGIAARLFTALANANINIILITQGSSEHSITFAISPHKTKEAANVLNKAFKIEMKAGEIEPLKIENSLSTIAVIGEGMRYSPGIAGKLFDTLGKHGINIIAIAQGSSELNISFVIKKKDEEQALNVIHASFFEETSTTDIHLYVCGTGLIGNSLLNQIKVNKKNILSKLKKNIQISGLINSRKMLLINEPLTSEWLTALTERGIQANLEEFINQMIKGNKPHSIFIDNTASEIPTQYYKRILEAGIAISTPNKVAASGNYNSFVELQQTAKKHHTSYNYETNVGAGLPILSTIRDLMNTGDKIVKIEGILSGSLSYIFNTYTADNSFHDIVKQAKELGYTEPDPRDDLSGKDVARKITILAREVGASIEVEDVNIQSILPQTSINAPSIDTFFDTLKENAAHFENLHQEGKVLRFIATYENGEASISLQAVGSEHPFYNMGGSDNIIAITTMRYPNPVVIRGAGAGAEVTAAGVFAEILSIE